MSKLKGGAESEISMFFSDIRGPTALAEAMCTTELGYLIERYQITCAILIRSEAETDKMVNDEVVAYLEQDLACIITGS